ncbi:hypothetical protein [Burkholderia diffusa]|uniref:hypothetical protein n=1 Tax=Burkholderia diffusa TaxID=488732 RepID=UPI000AAC8E73|nr:hypothetical protein [Burkholderia diffusa]
MTFVAPYNPTRARAARGPRRRRTGAPHARTQCARPDPRENNINANQVWAWRRLYAQGLLTDDAISIAFCDDRLASEHPDLDRGRYDGYALRL